MLLRILNNSYDITGNGTAGYIIKYFCYKINSQKVSLVKRVVAIFKYSHRSCRTSSYKLN